MATAMVSGADLVRMVRELAPARQGHSRSHMNAEEFREALRKLGLPLTAARTAALLGVSPSGLSKYGYGYRPVRPSTRAGAAIPADAGSARLAAGRRIASRLKIMAWKRPGSQARPRSSVRRPGAS